MAGFNGTIKYDPSQLAKSTNQPAQNEQQGYTAGTSQSGPAYPGYAPQAAQQTQDLVQSAQDASVAQKKRLQDYIGHLYQLRNFATQAAKGAAARGANGQQNPLQVYQAMQQLAAQAGVPIDAQISQALQQGNGIENTLNAMLDHASQIYTQLASINQSRSTQSSQGGAGGGVLQLGGPKQGGGQSGGPSSYTDISGNKSQLQPGQLNPRYNPYDFSNIPSSTNRTFGGNGGFDRTKPNGGMSQGNENQLFLGNGDTASSRFGVPQDPNAASYDGGDAHSDFQGQVHDWTFPQDHPAAVLPGINSFQSTVNSANQEMGQGGQNFSSSEFPGETGGGGGGYYGGTYYSQDELNSYE